MITVPSFQIGFWHPCGPHAGETVDEIIERKRREIAQNGSTLWSFQFRNSLSDWHREIEKAKQTIVLVFCSEGKGARDPISEKKHCHADLADKTARRNAVLATHAWPNAPLRAPAIDQLRNLNGAVTGFCVLGFVVLRFGGIALHLALMALRFDHRFDTEFCLCRFHPYLPKGNGSA
jgi:hypothetical protein